jgi:hypothetical protein
MAVAARVRAGSQRGAGTQQRGRGENGNNEGCGKGVEGVETLNRHRWNSKDL